MANYNCITRSNYFHVKDEKAFKMLMDKYNIRDEMLWDDVKDENGNKVFAFGFYSTLEGIISDDTLTDGSFENFLQDLQEQVVNGDAIIIFEVGHEKLRYVTGYAIIITSSKVRSIDLTTVAIDTAAKLLNNEDYTTRCEY